MDFASAPTLKTERLTLRSWDETDLAPFAEMSADSDVMRYFEFTMTRDESDAYVAELQDRFRKWGFGYWVIEAPGEKFAGFVGLSRPKIEAHFTPAIEIGWRLAKAHWGKGYATEGARAALKFGFDEVGADEIVSMASILNRPSLAVMERIGMNRDPVDDFQYPSDALSPELRPCALYRLRRSDWCAAVNV